MPRPDDFPAVGGVSGTVTINLTNLPAGADAQALVVPVEAVFNPNNSPRNKPHVCRNGRRRRAPSRRPQGQRGASEHRRVVITSGLKAGERVVAAGVGELHANQPVRIWTRERGL